MRARLRTHRGGVVAAYLFALLAVWLFWPALVGGKVLAGDDALLFEPPLQQVRPARLTRPSNTFLFDATYVFHPDQLAGREDLRHGSLPAWQPDVGAGQPLLASQQNAILFPLDWPLVLFDFWSALAWVAALKLVAAAAGTYLFLRALGLHPAAAALGGVAFGFGVYVLVWLAHPHANVYLLLPWLALFARRVARRGDASGMLGLAAAVGLAWLAGHPPSVSIVLGAVLAYAVFELLRLRDPATGLRRAGLILGALALGAVAGAVMLLPFREAVGQGYGFERGTAPNHPRLLLSFVFPELWGRPDKAEVAGGPLNFPERTCYIGVIPLLLAAGGLIARRRPEQLFFAGLGLAVLLVLLSNPLADAVRQLPGVQDVKLNRILILLAFSGAVLAGYGAQVLIDGSRRERLLLLVGAAAAAVVPLLWLAGHADILRSFGDALRQAVERSRNPLPTDVVEFATLLRWAALALIGLAACALAALRPRWAAVAAAIAVAATSLDLVTIDRGYHPAVARAAADPRPPAELTLLREIQGDQRVSADGILGPNVESRFGLRDARSHEQPALRRRSELWTSLVGGTNFRLDFLSAAAGAQRLADLFSVRYLLVPRLARPERFRPLAADHAIVENRTAFPRAWVAYGDRQARDLGEALRLTVASPARSLLARPVVEGTTSRRGGGYDPARVVREDDTHVDLSVRARRPGTLVLTDTFFPGWHARVDGRETAIRPANAAFRAVDLPAGRHRVSFEYRPASLRAGAAFSAVAWLAIGAALVGLLIRRRRGRG